VKYVDLSVCYLSSVPYSSAHCVALRQYRPQRTALRSLRQICAGRHTPLSLSALVGFSHSLSLSSGADFQGWTKRGVACWLRPIVLRRGGRRRVVPLVILSLYELYSLIACFPDSPRDVGEEFATATDGTDTPLTPSVTE